MRSKVICSKGLKGSISSTGSSMKKQFERLEPKEPPLETRIEPGLMEETL